MATVNSNYYNNIATAYSNYQQGLQTIAGDTTNGSTSGSGSTDSSSGNSGNTGTGGTSGSTGTDNGSSGTGGTTGGSGSTDSGGSGSGNGGTTGDTNGNTGTQGGSGSTGNNGTTNGGTSSNTPGNDINGEIEKPNDGATNDFNNGTTNGSTNSSTNIKDPTTLDSQAFLMLFLEQLKNQDPTAPMETQQILEQSAQLANLESQQAMKTSMEKMTKSMEAMQESNTKNIEVQNKMIESQQQMLESLKALGDNITSGNVTNGYNTVGMIGKIAETGLNSLVVEKNEPQKFSLYFDEAIDTSKGDAKITIKDKDAKVIKEISLKDYNGKKGWVEFEWDTKDSSGTYVPVGKDAEGKGIAYTITAEYNLNSATNQYNLTELGRGEVTSVLFSEGVPYIRLGLGDKALTVPIMYAGAFYEKGSNIPTSKTA